MTSFNFAEALQARICADLEAEKTAHTPRSRRDGDERRRDELLEVQIAALEEAVANAELFGEQRRQEAETAAKKIAELEAQIALLQQWIRCELSSTITDQAHRADPQSK